MTDVTLCIFQARLGPHHPSQMESLAKHTLRSFDLVYIYEQGTAAQNINRALDRVRTRYVAVCDDDVIFLEDHWLDKLLSVFVDFPNVALVTPAEIKTQKSYEQFQEFGRTAFSSRGTVSTVWNAGYVMLIDRYKGPLIAVQADENIPGKTGMSDLDICLQVRNLGYDCAHTDRTIVYHPSKLDNFEWREKYDMYHEYELAGLSQEQILYMRKKWGAFFDDAIPHRILSRLGD